MEDIYTIDELAKRWKCSRDVIYDLVHTRRLKGFKLGNAWRFTKATIEAYENNKH